MAKALFLPRTSPRTFIVSSILAASVLLFLVSRQYSKVLYSPLPTPVEIAEYDPANQRPSPASASQENADWEFNARRDHRNHGLSEAQCDKAFPGLYAEIDRAVAARKDKPVMEEDLVLWNSHNKDIANHTMHRLLIYDGQLRVTGYQKGVNDMSRGMSIISTIHRAMTALPDPSVIPNVEFVIDVEDLIFQIEDPPDRPVFGFLRRPQDENIWVMPDFNGWSFPDDAIGSYEEFRLNVEDVEKPFDEKIDKIAWRGAVGVNPDLRNALLHATEEKSWADVHALSWADPKDVLNMHEFCRYKFVSHSEGNSWSGRLRYLHNCHSVAVIHSLDYVAHYYPLLKHTGPQQNYIEVQRDFGDLEAEVMYYLEHPAEAQAIADESASTFRDRYLTPAAESCYWRRMLRSWATVQGFEPRLWTDGREGEEGPRRQRGASWERDSNRAFVMRFDP